MFIEFNEDPTMLDTMIKDVNMVQHGGALLEQAVCKGKYSTVDYLIRKGADIMLPPETVSRKPDYRQAPFSIIAAMTGDFKML